MTDDAILRRFSAIVDLTSAEVAALLALIRPSASFLPGQVIRSEGDGAPDLFVLQTGLVLSAIAVPDGGRHILGVHRQGNVLGLSSLPFDAAATSLTALTPVRASAVPLAALGQLFTDHPRLGAVVFLIGQQERAALMDRLVGVARFSARTRLAALLLAFFREGPPFADGTTLHLPLSQEQIGDLAGLSTVHVNRSFTSLRNDGLIRRRGRIYDLDVSGLETLVGMSPRAPRRDLSWLPPASL